MENKGMRVTRTIVLQLFELWDNPGKLVPEQTYPGELVAEQTFTHSLLSWLSASSICYNPQHPPVQFTCLALFFPNLQVFFGLPLGPAPSTSYSIHSSPYHCLLFAAHAHTIATCFAVVPRLCHLILVFLSTLYLELFLVA